MDRTDNQLITKSNYLVQESVDELNRKEQYLMAVLLAKFKADNPTATSIDEVQSKATTLTLSELVNFLDLDIHSGSSSERYKEVVKHFQTRAFITWVDDEYAHRTPIFKDIRIPKHWVDSSVAIKDKTYTIDFYWNDLFIPMIVTNTEFTELFKRSILALKTTPAIKLYQLLKSYSAKKWDTTITVADLRLRLGMTSKSYDRFDNFWARGIEKPIAEINKHTEINVTATKNPYKNDRRKIESITFKIKNNEVKKGEWCDDFPNVKLTSAEYLEISQWNTYPDWKRCCRDLQSKLDEGVDIRNHYKWIVGHHNELIKKHQATLEAPKSQSADDEFRALFRNPYMNE